MHLAAESHVDRSIDGPAAFIETNMKGTYTLLEVARQYWLMIRAQNILFIWNDSVLDIDWPIIESIGTLLSDKDRNALEFQYLNCL